MFAPEAVLVADALLPTPPPDELLLPPLPHPAATAATAARTTADVQDRLTVPSSRPRTSSSCRTTRGRRLFPRPGRDRYWRYSRIPPPLAKRVVAPSSTCPKAAIVSKAVTRGPVQPAPIRHTAPNTNGAM